MSDAKIFLVTDTKGALVPMTEAKYEKEDVLQTYLEDYPDLLAGDQINPESPRRWLLVAREMSVPGDSDQTGRWSLDHLYLDQDGTPTFVECKRSTDTRARREVVAQMLDYAANGLEYWSMDRLRQAATETASQQHKSIDDEVLELIDSQDEADIEVYWRTVERNLGEGKVRLIFVADETSRELRRLVEFMNEHMAGVEVLAIEVKQFIGGSKTALVPRVIGQTEASRIIKGGGGRPRSKTTESEFLDKCTEAARRIFESIINRAKAEKHTIYWGDSGFSIRFDSSSAGRRITYAYGFPPALFKLQEGYLPISEQEKSTLREQLTGLGFADAGEKAVRITLNEEARSTSLKGLERILEAVRRILEGEAS